MSQLPLKMYSRSRKIVDLMQRNSENEQQQDLDTESVIFNAGVAGSAASSVSSGRFITLRDYDFVGEDATLAARLAERMAVLQAPLNLSELAPPAARAPALRWQPPLQLRPDYLHSRVQFPQLVNVSLDYAELLNASDLFLEENASSLAFGGAGPELGSALHPSSGATLAFNAEAALVPSPGAAMIPGPAAGLVPGLRAALLPDPYAAPEHGLSAALGLSPTGAARPMDGRRSKVEDQYTMKALELIKHNIYSTQRKILELNLIIQKYEGDPRFRMAYIYNRLDEWKQNLRTVHYAMYRWRYYHLRVKRLIWYYEHSLRLTIDITYSIEHLIHLHTQYMKNMETIVPLKTRLQLVALKKQQQKLERMKQLGIPEGTLTK